MTDLELSPQWDTAQWDQVSTMSSVCIVGKKDIRVLRERLDSMEGSVEFDLSKLSCCAHNRQREVVLTSVGSVQYVLADDGM